MAVWSLLLHSGSEGSSFIFSYSTTPSHRRLHDRMPIPAVSTCSNVRVRKLGLLDQLVRKREQRGRHGETERLGDPDVNDQLELSRLLDGEVGGLCPLQDLVHEGGSPPEEMDDARPSS